MPKTRSETLKEQVETIKRTADLGDKIKKELEKPDRKTKKPKYAVTEINVHFYVR